MNAYNDRSKPITAEDIIRRYNLDKLNSDRKALNTLNNGLNKTNTNLENYVKSTLKSLSELQDQVDGNITTWFLNEVPTLENKPAIDWITDEEKNNHLGDLYYDQTTGYSYRFALVDEKYKWFKLTDSDITEALALANSAKDAADSKRRIFVAEPMPPYDVGDIWLGNETSDLYRCQIARQESDEFHLNDWIIATKYTDDTTANNAIAQLDEFKSQVKDNYVTNATLSTSVDSINAVVGSVQRKVDKKAQIFTSIPIPPYYVNDLYIIKDRCYVCIKENLEEYDPLDWKLDLDNTQYSTKSELNILDNSIQALTTSTSNLEQKTTQFNLDINQIKSELENVPTITTEIKGIGTLILQNLMNSRLIYLHIHPTSKDILGLFASTQLKTSKNLKVLSRKVYFAGDNNFSYLLPSNLYFYDENIYDEFIFNGADKKIYIIHRVGIDNEGNKYALEEEIKENFEYYDYFIGDGDYKIYMPSYPSAYISIKAMIKNDYTTQFATKLELSNSITQTSNSIMQEVNLDLDTLKENVNASLELKVDTNKLISQINAKADEINFESNKMRIKTDDFEISNGNATFSGKVIGAELEGNNISGGKIEVFSEQENANLIIKDPLHPDDIYGQYFGQGLVYRDSKVNEGNMTIISLDKYTKVKNFMSPTLDLYIEKNSNKMMPYRTTVSAGYINVSSQNDNGNIMNTIITENSVYTPILNQTSLESQKKNIEKFSNALSIINNIDLYKYNLKHEKDTDKKHIGFVIGDNYNYSNEITSVDEEGKEVGVDLYSMTSLCLQAIKEQQKIIEKLKKEINLLKESDK